jgi:homopolymeric O-antigen transport system ATP-binding protein
MADDIVIRAEELGKKYVIGHEAQRERYVALRDVIARSARNAWRMAKDMANGRVVVPGDTVEEFWALKGIHFEVKRGEVLGLIGRNGAGKSTLLKILSRITEPSEGRVTIKGRVASLLEVGTGFHPELTGRENIYLNGAVLGMTRAEIKRKFDEIVAFAEVEKFLDTPVKRYSSGMYVRLAFAVAAHLEPEILVVDEVLAVGDAEFQKKCLGKMHDVAGHGRTVLFVSHNMTTVQNLCQRAILLNNGRIAFEGNVAEAISQYSISASGGMDLPDPQSRKGNGKVRIVGVDIRNDAAVGADFWIEMHLDVKETVHELQARLSFYDRIGNCVSNFGTNITDDRIRDLAPGNYKLRLFVPRLSLNLGQYNFNVSLNGDEGSFEVFDVLESASSFSVMGGDPFGTGRLPIRGSVVMQHSWSIEYGV